MTPVLQPNISIFFPQKLRFATHISVPWPEQFPPPTGFCNGRQCSAGGTGSTAAEQLLSGAEIGQQILLGWP